MTDQYTFQNPTTQYPEADDSGNEDQSEPGLGQAQTPKPDSGEQTYRGTGRLAGRQVVVTGADNGIGRAAAIADAPEGADAVLSSQSKKSYNTNRFRGRRPR